jgi:hypothetical protein
MIGRKVALSLAAMLLVASTSVAPAFGACGALVKGKKGCANEIRACSRIVCSVVKGPAKKKCKKACKSGLHTACVAKATVCSASPSGAFVNLD